MERYLRRATTQDIKLLFKWANDSETRKNSFNTNPISWEEHQAWFARKIADDKSEIYIFMDFFVPVGMVRLDFEDEHTAVISYSIAA